MRIVLVERLKATPTRDERFKCWMFGKLPKAYYMGHKQEPERFETAARQYAAFHGFRVTEGDLIEKEKMAFAAIDANFGFVEAQHGLQIMA